MASDGQVNIALKISADTAGGRAAEQSLDRVEKKAKKSILAMVGGFSDAQRAAGRLSQAFNSFLKVGFFAESFNALTGFIDKLTSSSHKAKEEANALAAAQKQAADAARVEKTAAAYRKLAAEIADAAKARERANELEDLQRSAADKLEDDEAELKMREDLAALDQNDPLYDRKREQISARYETGKLRRSVARQRRDANVAADRTWQEREAVVGESTEKQFSLIDDRAELERLRREAAEKRAASTRENEFDNNTLAQRFGSNLKNILSLNWGKVGDDRSEKGNERRRELADEAKALEERVKAQSELIRAKEKEIADLDKTADHLSKKAGIQGVAADNAAVAVKSAEISAAATNNAADRALATEAAKVADAQRASQLLAQQRAELQSRIASHEASKSAANYAVYSAQGDYDAARLSGNRASSSSAHAALRSAQDAAQNVNHAADTAINALTETLRSVESRLKAAQNYLESQSKRQSNAWSEAPAGS